MGILVSPLLARCSAASSTPCGAGAPATLSCWCCAPVTFSMAKWMPETRPEGAPRTKLLTSYKTLFGTGAFNCYLLMLIGGLAGLRYSKPVPAC
jgi:DHA1 family 2-module integral membrane pump EmrD-like MFS transporter